MLSLRTVAVIATPLALLLGNVGCESSSTAPVPADAPAPDASSVTVAPPPSAPATAPAPAPAAPASMPSLPDDPAHASSAGHTALGEYMTEIATLRRGLDVPDGQGVAQPAIVALGGSPRSSDIAPLTKLKTAYEEATRSLLAQHAPDSVQPHRLLLIETLTLATTSLGKRIVAASTGDKFAAEAKRAETKLNAMHEKLNAAEVALNAKAAAGAKAEASP